MSKNLRVGWESWLPEAILRWRHGVNGNWNPQLLRELKSRLSWRNAVAAVVLSIGLQILVLAFRWTKLPDRHTTYDLYCQAVSNNNSHCAVNTVGEPLISWIPWWSDTSATLSIMMFVGAIVAGVYSLARSFSQEAQRGTLDFLRLSPMEIPTLLVGKLLGVPILIYFAVATALPLQFYGAQAAHISRLNVLTWDLAMVGLITLFYLGAILATLWFKVVPIVMTIASLLSGSVLVLLSLRWAGKYDESTLQWYGIRLYNHPFSFLLLTAMAGLGIYWLYQALKRRYLQPSATILSRVQSYWWSGCYHLFLLGFCTEYSYDLETKKYADRLSFRPNLHTYQGNGSDDTVYGNLPGVFWTLILGWVILLIFSLLPSLRSLNDWAKQDRTKSGWTTMLWDDRSPGILAVMVNVGIAFTIWVGPSIGRLSEDFQFSNTIVSMVFNQITFIGMVATVAHLGLFWQFCDRQFWKTSLGSSLLFFPPICLFSLMIVGSNSMFWYFLFPSLLMSLSLFLIPWASIPVMLSIWIGLLLWFRSKLVRLKHRALAAGGQSSQISNLH
jgi:hypothetical protein